MSIRSKMIAKENFIFRRAKIEDIKVLRQMIQELAEYHDAPDGPKQSIEDLIRDSGLRGGAEYFHPYVLELKSEDSECSTPIGYAVCYIFWSSWAGKTYFLENFYVKPEYRNIGAGKHLLCEIAAIVKRMGYKRLGFHVTSWNSAQQFYKKLGAIDITALEGRLHFRLEEDKITELAEQIENIKVKTLS